MGKLDGKVAVVTGGLSGIGRQVSMLFAEEGAQIGVLDLLDRSRDDGLGAEELVSGLPYGGVYVQGDVAKEEDVARAFETVVDRLGRIDVLVTCAGIVIFKPINEFAIEDFDRTMAINVRGTFLCCREAIAQMRKQPERGTIVTIASNFAFVAAPEASVYCASKGAVATLSKALALELGPEGIRVNALCPGATATELNRAHRSRPEILADWAAKTPLRLADRPESEFLGVPAEIARSALFLACDDSIYMTGAALVVDGGWNAQ